MSTSSDRPRFELMKINGVSDEMREILVTRFPKSVAALKTYIMTSFSVFYEELKMSSQEIVAFRDEVKAQKYLKVKGKYKGNSEIKPGNYLFNPLDQLKIKLRPVFAPKKADEYSEVKMSTLDVIAKEAASVIFSQAWMYLKHRRIEIREIENSKIPTEMKEKSLAKLSQSGPIAYVMVQEYVEKVINSSLFLCYVYYAASGKSRRNILGGLDFESIRDFILSMQKVWADPDASPDPIEYDSWPLMSQCIVCMVEEGFSSPQEFGLVKRESDDNSEQVDLSSRDDQN